MRLINRPRYLTLITQRKENTCSSIANTNKLPAPNHTTNYSRVSNSNTNSMAENSYGQLTQQLGPVILRKFLEHGIYALAPGIPNSP